LDSFTRRDLEQLIGAAREPAVSIYLPPSGGAPDPDGDRLRFRSALARARDELGDRDALGELEPLARDAESWMEGGGTAVFHAPGFVRRYRLPVDFPELVVVGRTFHTHPLLEILQAPDRFWVLELGQGRVRLWRGDALGIARVDAPDLPEDMESVLGYEYLKDAELVHRGVRRGDTAARAQTGGAMGAFSGHGVGDYDREAPLKRFFTAVDEAVVAEIGPGRDPVILAAVTEHHPLYRSVTRIEGLTSHGIEASIRDWSGERIHGTAWPIALEAAEARIDAALALWERSYGLGKAEADLASLGSLAVAGRLRALMTERGRRLWGTFDRRTGALEVIRDGGDDPGPDAVELLDELAEIVLLKGGAILVVPPDRMPTDTGAAGILR